jgi:predicted DNA-binding ribbon-helix-helix protein
MRHRILQHAGRRYSVKLDDVVWDVLEELADNAGLRLNELVARVAATAGERAGLTNALRSHCIQALRDRLSRLAAEVQSLSLTTRGVPAALYAEACPAPCFLIGRDQLVLDLNQPAQRWMSAPEHSLVGKRIDHYLQIKSVPAIEEIVRQFRDGGRKVFAARVLHVRPGRLVMASANLCPAVLDGPDNFAYFLLIDE